MANSDDEKRELANLFVSVSRGDQLQIDSSFYIVEQGFDSRDYGSGILARNLSNMQEIEIAYSDFIDAEKVIMV